MTIFVKDNVDESFVRLIPAFVISKVKSSKKNLRYRRMNNYLMENYKISLDEVISFLRAKGFSFNKVMHTYSVSINQNIVEPKSGIKIIDLCKLVDYGNADIKGTGLFDGAMEYVSSNMLNIYRFYMMKQGGGK